MPLSELPSGHVGRNGLMAEPPGNSEKVNPPSKIPNAGTRAGFLGAPSSIQSMLKNTTETGDVGQFSIKPTRIPSMTYRTPKSPSTAQPIPTKKGHVGGRHHEQSNGGHQPMHPDSDTASTVATSYHSHNQRSYRDTRRRSAAEDEDERSYSMTQSSITSQSFSHRPSPNNFQLQGQGNLHGMRPRSPFAYPTRLKRPGYRPSSPAFSDYNKSITGTYTGSNRAPSLRTASPLSIYPPKSVPPMWQQDANRSDPVLRYYATSPRPEDYGEPLPSSVRGLLSQLPNGVPSRRSLTPTQFSDISNSRRPSPSPSPVYYDYTESFVESHYRSASKSSFSVAEQVIPEDMPKVYHELDGTPAIPYVTELQAPSSLSQGLLQKPADALLERRPTTQIARKEVPSSRPPAKNTKHLEVKATKEKWYSPPMVNPNEGHEVGNLTVHTELPGPLVFREQKTPENDPALNQKSHRDTAFSPEQSQRARISDASLISIRLSSSSDESMYSVKSSSRRDRQTPVPDSTEPNDTTSPSPVCLEIPLIQSTKSTTPAREVQSIVASIPRGTSLDRNSDTTVHTEIYAPTPERAASYLSNRNRFSWISSLDDNLADVEKLASNATVDNVRHDRDNMKTGEMVGSSTVTHLFEYGNTHPVDFSHGRAKFAQPTANKAGSGSRPRIYDISKNSSNLPAIQIPRRSSSRSLDTAMSGTSAEPKIPPRRSSYVRKPAYHMFEQVSRTLPGLPAVTEDHNKMTALSGDKSSKSATVPRAMKELPQLPREPTLIAYPPPIGFAPSDLPFNFTPLVAHQKDEIQPVDVDTLEASTSNKSAGLSTTPAELSAVVNARGIDMSPTPPENRPTGIPEQSVAIRVDERQRPQISHAKLGSDIQADHNDTSDWQSYSDSTAVQSDSVAEAARNQSLTVPAPRLEPGSLSNSAISSSMLSESDNEEQAPIPKYKLKMRADKDLPPRSQPWNLDDSYPWTNQSPKLDVTMPKQSEDLPERPSSAIPRFKLRIHRASSNTAGTTKISKQRQSTDSALPTDIDVSNDLFRARVFGRKPRPSITIGQENSSQSPHLQTRFKESFEQSPANFAISPTITLVPPSPGLNLEARSFFSDDSSQIETKGSLRKRLSQLRAMASRNTMSEEGRSFERGAMRSRASGRISKQSTRTADGASHFRSVRAKVADKVREWLLRGGEKFRDLWNSRGE